MTTIFKCIRCGYSTDHKSHMKDHLKRKLVCCPNESNILLTNEVKNDILHICNYCNKSYKDKEHHEISCRNKKQTQTQTTDEKIEELRKEIEDMKKNQTSINIETQNIIQNNNNTYNIDIKLLAYDSFTTRHIDRKWLFDNILETQEEPPKFIERFFEYVHLNEDIPENHNIFCICMTKNQNNVYVYTDQRLVKELSTQELYNFINKNVKSRIRYLLNDRENIFLAGSYENLPDDDKSQYSEENYEDIKNSIKDILCDETKEFPEILEILKNNTTPQYTIADLHKKKPILMPTKAKNYIEYIAKEFIP
jgi:hypothetical protein